MPTPRQNALVRFDFDNLSEDYLKQYPFSSDSLYVFLGEIPNMPGHCIVAEHPTGKIYSGYHIEHFREIVEDDV